MYYLPKSESKLSFNTRRRHYFFIQKQRCRDGLLFEKKRIKLI